MLRTILAVLLLITGCGTPNISIAPAQSAVFMGDSITAMWDLNASFLNRNYVNKGVHSDTTAMMLARFNSDVVQLHPAIVVILGGTNDMLPGRSIPDAEANIQQMVNLATSAGIKPIVCTIPPIDGTPQGLGDLRPRVLQYNADLKAMGFGQCDYFKVLAGPDSLPLPGVVSISDGVHPTAQGYALMTIEVSKLL